MSNERQKGKPEPSNSPTDDRIVADLVALGGGITAAVVGAYNNDPGMRSAGTLAVLGALVDIYSREQCNIWRL